MQALTAKFLYAYFGDARMSLQWPLRGIVPPLVTPLTDRGEFDGDSYSALIDRVVKDGVHGLFLLGSTGEFCSLSADVRKQAVTEGCRATASRVPVIVNVSETSLEESLDLTTHAAKTGAAGVAVCPPYYFSVTQNDLVRYGQKLAQAADLPVFLYNIPQNAHVQFEVETVLRLAEVPNIVGLKNSNGEIDYIFQTSQIKTSRPEFSILVGTEEIILPAMQSGADGSVCGGANLFPALYVKLFDAIEDGRSSDAQHLQELIVTIANEIYSVGDPSTSYIRGLKGAMTLLGVCGETLAEPLQAFDGDDKQELRSRLNRLLPEINERN